MRDPREARERLERRILAQACRAGAGDGARIAREARATASEIARLSEQRLRIDGPPKETPPQQKSPPKARYRRMVLNRDGTLSPGE